MPDVYVCFGQDESSSDRYHDWIPEIMGDCTDSQHKDWCELRDTGFSVTFPHQEKQGDDQTPETAAQHLDHVTLKKRVDWASTRLFLKCCQAAKAKVAKNKTDQDIGTIHTVYVEICKDAGKDAPWDEEEKEYISGKFPYLAVEYENVRILSFSIDMSGPEPAETIEFEYDSFKLGYQKTDPETGLPIAGELEWTAPIHGTKKSAQTSGGESDSAENGSAANSVASVGSLLAAQGSSQSIGAVTSHGDGGSGGTVSTAADAAVGANFPGVWGPTGFGVLPD